MLIKGSRATVADNSGALECELFGIYKGSVAKVGSIVKVAIKKVIPNGKIKKGDKSKALVIRTKYCVKTETGHRAYAAENAVVLITEKFEPVGTRIFGFASRKAFQGNGSNVSKMASLCEEVY